jgi:hypothetical protein
MADSDGYKMSPTGDKPSPDDKRPWYRTRRFYGGLAATIGGALILAPGAPVLFAIGALPVTANMLGLAITNIGGIIFGYGYGAKVEREKKDK